MKDGLRFLLIILKISTFFSPLKVFIPISAAILMLGIGYGLYRIFVYEARYGQTSALLITTAILVFLVGLISEQIAQLRFEHSETFMNSNFKENSSSPIYQLTSSNHDENLTSKMISKNLE
jgi:hypothetical protein